MSLQQIQKIDSRILTILLIVFVQIVGASMVLPVLPLFAQREFELSPQTITLLLTTFFAAQFVAGPFIGRLSDRHGRVPILIISQIGTALSFLMIALAGSFEMLFLARLLDGITGGNIIVAQAYITDITPPQKRTEALGSIFAMFGLGFVIGPAIGGVLSAAFGIRFPFVIAAIAAALTTLLTWLTLDETVSTEQRLANRQHRQSSLSPVRIIQNFPLLMVLTITFVGQFGLGIVQATFALFGDAVLFVGFDERITALGIGLLLAVIGLSQFFTQIFLLRRMLNRFGDSRLVVISTVMRAFSMIGLALSTGPLPALPGSALFAIGTGLMMPPLQSLATRTVDDEVRGGILGLHQSVVSLSTIISTALGGQLFAIQPTTPYWVGAGFFFAALAPAMILLRWFRTHELRVAPSIGD